MSKRSGFNEGYLRGASPLCLKLGDLGVLAVKALPPVLLAALAVAGCGPKGEPPVAVANAPAANAPGKPPKAEKPPQQIAALSTKEDVDFTVATEHRSLAVMYHYEKALTGAGWKHRTPKTAKDRGQRRWTDMDVTMGPQEFYDAAWVDPKTKRVAVLSLWHVAGEDEVQHGTFEIHPNDGSL
jgi:hypothetical protein